MLLFRHTKKQLSVTMFACVGCEDDMCWACQCDMCLVCDDVTCIEWPVVFADGARGDHDNPQLQQHLSRRHRPGLWLQRTDLLEPLSAEAGQLQEVPGAPDHSGAWGHVWRVQIHQVSPHLLIVGLAATDWHSVTGKNRQTFWVWKEQTDILWLGRTDSYSRCGNNRMTFSLWQEEPDVYVW